MSVKINQTSIHFLYPRNMIIIKVKCYSGFKADERPISFAIDGKEFMVKKIIDQWRTQEYECFKVLADDGREYILKHDVSNDEWDFE